jgi:hypothetical protein
MKLLGPIDIPSDGTRYIPAPCRGVVIGAFGIWETSDVEVGDTIIVSRATTAVCTITATETAGLVREDGVRDATNKDLVFDPDSDTVTDGVIKLVANGAAGISTVFIEFDDYATVEQTASEA